MDLVGSKQVADILGVSKGRITQLVTSGELPKPLGTTSGGPVWQRKVIERWAEANRPQREDTAA